VNVEQPAQQEQQELAQTLALFSQHMEAFLTPLVTTLQSNKHVDIEMIEAIKALNLNTGKSVKSSETHIQKISRELLQDRENNADGTVID
jgi:ABC-type Zn2+ transport system substrate-binding protein/surface adhesin